MQEAGRGISGRPDPDRVVRLTCGGRFVPFRWARFFPEDELIVGQFDYFPRELDEATVQFTTEDGTQRRVAQCRVTGTPPDILAERPAEVRLALSGVEVIEPAP